MNLPLRGLRPLAVVVGLAVLSTCVIAPTVGRRVTG
jgi:hypothetical protein